MTAPDRQRSRWEIAATDDVAVRALSGSTGLSPVTAAICLSRGLDTEEKVRVFFEPSLERDWVATNDIPGLARAAERVASAVRAGERILVFGDFDLDGISSAAVAETGLRALGAEVSATVPHRFDEGYGLTEASVARIIGLRPDLVVTVDCGIASVSEVAILLASGIDVVVTDHHEPGTLVPEGVPVANPKLRTGGPELAGAGVALALLRAVGELLGEPDSWRELVDLAMLGTVADVVPLLGPNRALAAAGLARVRERPRVGLSALCGVSGVPAESLTAGSVAFGLAPRLNAAGRMADPGIALELLTTTDAARADELARALDEHNQLRQTVEADLMDAAIQSAEAAYSAGDRVVIAAGEGWHEGVRGIVASRLVSRFGVPALVFGIEDGEAGGSGRSVPGVDLFGALRPLGHRFTRFGGHEAAVGLTLPAERLDELRAGLAATFAALPDAAFEPSRQIDAAIRLDEASLELAAEFDLLEPFGAGNPQPTLAVMGVFMNNRRRVGKTASHLRFTAFDGVAALPAIAFRCPDIDVLEVTEAPVDLAFELAVDEWRGARRVQLMVRDVRAREAGPGGGAAALLEELFERAGEILARGEYAGITDAESFHTKLAGVTFEGRQETVARLAGGTPLRIERQPDNPHDANACALFDPHGEQVGFFNRRLAAVLAPVLDAGVEYDVVVSEVTGGAEGESLGVNVLVSRPGALEDDAAAHEAAVARREQLAALSPQDLDAALVAHFLGDGGSLHGAQTEALGHLASGTNALVVMATGRGKSLIFHLHAARLAISGRGASVFVFPLRALVADQAFHLEEAFAAIGCDVRTLTGETAPGGRDDAFADLAAGCLDVVLTTPEFLERHAERFADAGRIAFIVIDEAHHVGLARAGHRPAYSRLGGAIERLGSPTVLAVTATAPPEVASAIEATLGPGARIVLDPTVRENLRLVDQRSCGDKVSYVAALAARGEKSIIYVNSREVSVQLARQLRQRVPELVHSVSFYNGGLTRSARHAVERAFRAGELTVVVATSAFGEGVNIPDVRHVVLYHLPFGGVEFNQMSGRGGRDGEPASVHLVFSSKDARINRRILESQAPERDDLAALYLALRDQASADGTIETTNAELAEAVLVHAPKTTLNDRGVSAGIGIFRELGLVESEGMGSYRRLRLLPKPDTRLELTNSVRYAEGRDEVAEFDAFREWALGVSADDLLHAFNRPILPKQSPAVPS